MLAVASGHMSNVLQHRGPRGGSPEDPLFLYTIEEEGVCNTGGPLCNGNWHSAGFSWDGEVIILGWEPGGGASPSARRPIRAVKKSAFFYDADTGAKLGQWTLPRTQSATENCTIHNYNTVPLRSGKRRARPRQLPGGNVSRRLHGSGEPADAGMVRSAADRPDRFGGAWSSYWYNDYIYETKITKGLNVFGYTGPTGPERSSSAPEPADPGVHDRLEPGSKPNLGARRQRRSPCNFATRAALRGRPRA